MLVILLLLMTRLHATEVYICGYPEPEEYCQLISEPEKKPIYEPLTFDPFLQDDPEDN